MLTCNNGSLNAGVESRQEKAKCYQNITPYEIEQLHGAHSASVMFAYVLSQLHGTGRLGLG